MSFNPKDNPLKFVKVEIRELCNDNQHYANLIIWGMCTGCKRTFGLSEENTPVFKRLDELKKMGV